jgi:hypothetical protein
MNVNDIYGGDWLKSEHLQGDTNVTVEGCTVHEMGEEKRKQLVLSFRDQSKQLGLNKTNAETMSSMFGTETNDWISKKVCLWVDENVYLNGKRVCGVRIKSAQEEGNGTPF